MGNPMLLLAHHFVQYTVLLGGAYHLGTCISERLCVPRGAPGTAFYTIKGLEGGLFPALLETYYSSFNLVETGEFVRKRMLSTIVQAYCDIESIMDEVCMIGVTHLTTNEGH